MKYIASILFALLLLFSGAWAKSSKTSSSWKASSGWGSSPKRPGSSGKATTSIPLGMKTEKINTASLSQPNRSVVSKAPVAQPVAPKPAPTVSAPLANGKINTASLSDPNRGAPKAVVAPPAQVASAKAPATVQNTVTPVPAPQQVVNKTVIVNKYVHHTNYDVGYRHSVAPVIMLNSVPMYSYHGSTYPIIIERDHYYSNVGGQRVELNPNDNGSWDEVTPQVSAPEPVRVATPTPKAAPAPQVKEESHVVRNLLIAFLVVVLICGGVVGFVLLRGDKGLA